MKTAVVLASTLAVASAFAPAQVNSRSGTELMAKKGATEGKKTFFSSVFEMDLFAPNPDINTYGARAKKNVSACGHSLGIWMSLESHFSPCSVVSSHLYS